MAITVAAIESDPPSGISVSDIGVADGVCPLDSGAKIDLNFLPTSVISGLKPMGEWDASGGTYPTPTTVGEFWWISVAGTIGGVVYSVHDWIVYVDDSPVTWKKVDNTDVVTAVDGQTGNVLINTKTFIAGTAIASPNVCYLASTGKMLKAQANNEANGSGLLAIPTISMALDDSALFSIAGCTITYGSWTWSTIGAKLYLSPTVAGGITDVKPATSTNIVRIIGYVLSATSILFCPDNTYVVVT